MPANGAVQIVRGITARMLAVLLLLAHHAAALEEDRAHHGPLDGHAVKVFALVEQMKLPDEALHACRKAAEDAQGAWRAWYASNRTEVAGHQRHIEELRTAGDKAELKRALAEKKKFMHTAPSLLRNPEPIKAILTPEDYARFVEKLEALKKELHEPGPG